MPRPYDVQHRYGFANPSEFSCSSLSRQSSRTLTQHWSNSVILPRATFEAVRSLEGDIGARPIIESAGLPVTDVEIAATPSPSATRYRRRPSDCRGAVPSGRQGSRLPPG